MNTHPLKFFFVIVAFLFASCIKPTNNNNTIYGTVIYPTFSNGDVKPLPNFKITLVYSYDSRKTFTTATDSLGQFEFDKVVSGKYTISTLYTDSAGHFYTGSSGYIRVYNNTRANADVRMALTGK